MNTNKLNTIISANTNRGPVVIERTTRENSKVDFIGMDKEIHRALSKSILRKTLYSWAPVYRMITINGVYLDGALSYSIDRVVHGNSPVAREFTENNQPSRVIQVTQIDENNEKTFRTITTESKDSRITYSICNSLVLVNFSQDMNIDIDMTAQELVEEILSKGLSVKDKEVLIGKHNDMEFLDPLVWTPSNERNGQILFTNLDPEVAWNKLEKIGGGAMSRALSKELPLDKFRKLASRLGLFATPAIEFVKVGTENNGVLVLDHDLTGQEDFNEQFNKVLSSIGVEIDAKQWDGAAIFSAGLALEGLKNIGMKNVDIKKALMYAFQLRVSHVYAKVFGEAVHQSVLNKMAGFIMSFLDESKYKIYGNKNNITMILDSNAAKLVDLNFKVDEAEGMMVYLLDIAKASSSGTSSQMIDKFMLLNKAAIIKFLVRKAKAECDNYVNSIGDCNTSLLNDDVNVWQTLLGIAKANGDVALLSEVLGDQNIVARILKDANKKHASAYRKGRVDIASSFERALFDFTYLLTDGKVDSLLGVDSRGAIECYSTDILEDYAAEIAEIENSDMSIEEQDKALTELLSGAIIKYPTPGMEEIELVVFLTEKQIRRRISNLVNNNVIDGATARLLFNYFQFTSYGVIKIAADNALKHKLAGMDTDYDGVVVVLEKELIDILENVYLNRIDELKDKNIEADTHGGVIPFIVSGPIK